MPCFGQSCKTLYLAFSIMTESKKENSNDDPSGESPGDADAKKRKLYVGLDLGTLQSCILSRLSKPGSEENHGILVPTVVGYPEDGILAGILPGNAKMLHGNEALANELHLRLSLIHI